MILVGTPNKGISYKSFGGYLGIIIAPVYWVLANKYFCNIPVFYQLLKGGSFLKEMNDARIPSDCYFISGSKDTRIEGYSSDPHGIGYVVQCDHHLFKFDGKSVAELSKKDLNELLKTAVPVVVSIINSFKDQTN